MFLMPIIIKKKKKKKNLCTQDKSSAISVEI